MARANRGILVAPPGWRPSAGLRRRRGKLALVETVEVPGYSGRGISAAAGSTIRVTDVEGAQICDLFALVQADPTEFLCTARTRALTQRLFPAVGQQFFTNRYRPILTFLADRSPGVHDSLFASCDPGLHALLGGGASHPNCHENFLAAARELGLDLSGVPGPVNLFQNTPVRSDGSLRGRMRVEPAWRQRRVPSRARPLPRLDGLFRRHGGRHQRRKVDSPSSRRLHL